MFIIQDATRCNYEDCTDRGKHTVTLHLAAAPPVSVVACDFHVFEEATNPNVTITPFRHTLTVFRGTNKEFKRYLNVLAAMPLGAKA